MPLQNTNKNIVVTKECGTIKSKGKNMKYLKKSLEGKIPYYSKEITDGIILNANESAFETPREIVELTKKELDKLDLRRYPDTDNTLIRESIAKAYKLNIENVTIGVGSDQLLDCIFKSMIDDEYIVSCNPTFSMYKEYASFTNCKFIDVDFKDDVNFEFDTDKIIDNIKKYNPKLVIICSPNNPTGSAIKRNDLELIIKETNGVVLLDEAYAEFYETNYDFVNKYDNLVVLKTFSKAYALAGIRLGYALANKDLIDTINVVKPPYNMSRISSIIASIAIEHKDLYEENIKKIINLRDVLFEDLNKLGLNPVKSYSNFIFIKLNDKIYNHLLQNKIYIRRLKYKNEYWHRITVGREQENEVLINCIKQAL